LRALERWANALGTETYALALTASADDDDYGTRGVAIADVAKGDVVVRARRETFLTASEARACERAGAFASTLTSFQCLAVKVLYEKARGKESFWAPYLRTLPETFDAHPLLWSEDYLPRTSCDAGRRIHERIDACEDDVALFRALRVGETVVGDSNWPSLRDVKWVTAMLTSRAFHLGDLSAEAASGDSVFAASDDARDDEILRACADLDDDVWERGGAMGVDELSTDDDIALVPFADALNHSSFADAASILTYDAATRTASLRAHKAYKAGEQVFDSYGLNLSASDTLINYGFVEVSSTRAKFVEFRGDEFEETAARVLDELNKGYEKLQQLPGMMNASATVLRVDEIVGVGENALIFCESFFQQVVDDNDDDDDDACETKARDLALETVLRLCDAALRAIDEATLMRCQNIVKGFAEGATLFKRDAAAYVIACEHDAVRNARRAVIRQKDELKKECHANE